MSDLTAVEATGSKPFAVTRTGNDTVVYINPKLFSAVMLIVAAVAGCFMAADSTGMYPLSSNMRFLSEAVFSLALWFPMNHHRNHKQ